MFDLSIVSGATVFFVFGAILGSFANVVIYRLPKGQSVVKPRSRCQSCEKQVSWFDNIPILSWMLLLGKCRNCKAKISVRYPLVEALTGALFCGLFLYMGISWTFLELLIFVFGLVIVTFIDFDHFILPDVFTIGGTALGLFGAMINPERPFLDSLYGILMGGGFLWAVAYFYFLIRKEEGLGGGDIKLLAWIGAVLGWKSIPVVILTSTIVGSIVGIGVAWRQGKGMKTVIPFGPYLALGAILYVFGGQAVADWYLGLFLPGIE